MKRPVMWLIVGLAVFGLLSVMNQPFTAFAAEKAVVIGFTASQTGKLNVEGMRQINGLNLWIEQANKAGGIKLADGTVVKLTTKFYDDESNKDRVQELYTRLINVDKADFLVSPYSSGLADAAAVIAQQYKRIIVTAGAASDSTHKKGYTLVYQMYTPASRYLTGTIDMMGQVDPKSKKVAIVYEKDKFSTDVVTALKEYAEKKGYNIALFEGYDSGNTDFAPFINKFPADVDAILGGGHFSDGTTFARQLSEKKVKAKMIALLVATPEPQFAELGDAAVGVIGPTQWEPDVKYSPEEAKKGNLEWYGLSVADFIAAYKAKYQEDPSYHSAGGYAAGLILQKAMEMANSTETEKIKEALDKLDLLTFYGHVKFDPTPKSHGLQEGHNMIYIQWQKGEGGKLAKQVVWPPEAKTAEIMYPAR